MDTVCVAFKAHMGWLNAVAMRCNETTPTPLHVQRLDLFDATHREVSEPYHVAGGWHGLERVPAPDDPSAVIAQGRHKQAQLTTQRLAEYNAAFSQMGLHWTYAVMLTGRGRLGNWQHMLGSHTQIHVAEGEAIRDATRTALDALAVPHCNQDEKSVLSTAAQLLRSDPQNYDELMKGRKPAGAKSWRKEERLIALAAWLHSRPGTSITE